MDKIERMIYNLRRLTPDVMRRTTLAILQDHEKVAVAMVTDQLWAGEMGNGDQLWDYSPVSVSKYGKPPGRVRMYDQGDFYDGVFMNATKFPVVFGSKDSKTTEIMRMVDAHNLDPDELLKPNKENTQDLVQYRVLPDLQAIVKAAIWV